MTETELLNNVIELCGFLGARTLHIRPARTQDGWRTPVQGDGKGFPDLLIITRDHRLLFRELKAEYGRMSAAQDAWLAALVKTGASVGVWWPRDWFNGVIKAELSAARSTNGVA